MSSQIHFTSALDDFRRARRQEAIQSILSRLAGKSDTLLSYDEFRKHLHAIEQPGRKLKDIPIDAIVGSVNRYKDFYNHFLPKNSVDSERWARVKMANQTMAGLPPIEVYQLGEVFFVLDGNHRVSIAYTSGLSMILAYVRDVQMSIPIKEGFDPDEIILRSEHRDFLYSTQIDSLRPTTNFNLTSPGKYPILQQQIKAIYFAMERKKGGPVAFQQAVVQWHDRFYMPIIEIIREKDLLKEFPSRTETDLFLWIIKHKADLQKELNIDINANSVINLLSKRSENNSGKFVKNIRKTYHNWLYGPPVGEWRKEQLLQKEGRLFRDILLVLTGSVNDKAALEMGFTISKLEGSQLAGLYISRPIKETKDYRIGVYQKEFNQKCKESNLSGNISVVFSKNPITQILRRTQFANLVILSLESRKRNPFCLSKLIQHCPTPLIIINNEYFTPLSKVLLVFDGSPKTWEALFMIAYISKFWELNPVILSVVNNKSHSEHSLFQVYEYLEQYGVNAEFIKASGPASIATTTFAVENQCDLIVMGGYSSNKIKRVISGSIVDEVIHSTCKSVLICK